MNKTFKKKGRPGASGLSKSTSNEVTLAKMKSCFHLVPEKMKNNTQSGEYSTIYFIRRKKGVPGPRSQRKGKKNSEVNQSRKKKTTQKRRRRGKRGNRKVKFEQKYKRIVAGKKGQNFKTGTQGIHKS